MSPRTPGHSLITSASTRRPIAHDESGARIMGPDAETGPGRARCQCGAMSETLPGAHARRKWYTRHREHASGMPWTEGETTP